MLLAWIIGLAVLAVWYGSYWTVRKDREDAKEMKEKFLNVRGFGYEEKSLDDFLRLLKAYDTTVLVDVRGSSYPVPRKEFTHEMLSQTLEKHDIKYVSLPALGINKYDAPNFWEYGTPEGDTARKKYRNSLDSETAQQALAYLRKLAHNDSVALMCVESRDEKCHRDVILQYLRGNRNG